MKIIITNKSQYGTTTCCNGGGYSFTETYIAREDGRFDLIHSTSSEFPYCPLCGSFYQEACPCGMSEPDVVDCKKVTSEIAYALRQYAQGQDFEIAIEK